jgi:hypothetical protein
MPHRLSASRRNIGLDLMVSIPQAAPMTIPIAPDGTKAGTAGKGPYSFAALDVIVCSPRVGIAGQMGAP